VATPGLMFDPSILLHEATLRAVQDELEASAEQAYVPARFLLVADNSFSFDPSSPATFFGTEGDSERAGGLFRDWQWDRRLIPYEAPDQPDVDDEVGNALLRLEGVDDDVRRILFEEWWYLQHESWIKATIDACANAFEKAGGVAADLGADGFNAVIDKAQEVPALLKRPGVRKAGKWTLASGIGVGVEFALLTMFPPGAAVLPIILAARGGAIADELVKKGLYRKKGFLKFDP
jgi:hypothetical protein